ncbi:(2Fe-2S)-binding protein [Kitasatospora atroaurantiaca]|uniref:FhuF-like iron-sulfur protein n=1 Tax=Kitasatospora atroaurantiaca TaxID=285545 RepID=A0A561ELH8_9ACTN|nr:(2Fe-2S)-binding protein [Kitasatospora atroaurantiaca]TWE16422.1 FhuF-like iron-sulfur protein [Kitasatospora atroaurantiaca]
MTVSSIEPRPAAPEAEVTPEPEATPLLGSYARIGSVFPELRISPGAPRSGDGWTATTEFVQNLDALRELIAFDARQGLAEYGEPLRPDVAAGFCLHRYTWPVALLFTVPWLLERRVPRIPVEQVSIRRSTGELTVRALEFSCLPDDPAAALPGARVLPDEAALGAELLVALTEHLTPVLAAFRREVRRGPHTLWGMATDDVIEGLWYLGSLLGEEQRAAADLAKLLPGTEQPPFVGGAGFRLLEQPGAAPMRTRTRVSCCLFYTVRPAEACFSCPRTCTEQK